MKKILITIACLFLLMTGCSVSETQVIEAVQKGQVSVIKSWVGKDKQKANFKDASGYTLLQLAAAAGQNTSVATLLDLGADPEALAPSGHTALLLAISLKKEDCAITLINKGANINAINNKDQKKSALHYAAEKGLLDCSKLLVEKGHPVDLLDGIRATPLNWAAYRGTLDIVKFLISKGADRFLIDNYGDNAFTSADDNPDKTIKEYLLTLPKENSEGK